MAISLKKKFLILSVAMIISVLAARGASDYNDKTQQDTMENQALSSRVIQRHMESDMMHDAIRADMLSTLLSLKQGDVDARKTTEDDFVEHSENFIKNIDENLKEPISEQTKQLLTKTRIALLQYNEAAKTLIQKSDYESANALFPAFSEKFSVLEKSLGEVSETILKEADDEKNTAQSKQATVSKLTLLISGINFILALSVPIFAARSLFRPLNNTIESMNKVAQGNLGTAVQYTDRQDEIGNIARALQVFKTNAQDKITLEAQQKQRELEAEEEKAKTMHALAKSFEMNVKGVVDMVASAATEMEATSRSVGQIVDSSKTKLSSLTNQIEGTSRSVQSVASATSQLSSAVNEINQQITRATSITAQAVDEAHKADITVQTLTEAAGKIGEVVEMINTIAAQINLLALNATIEAARAGDAGKGFAVVASEVKNLATQTTKATEQIAQFINSIQGATSETVTAINSIGGKIRQINEISTTIAAAVEEQSVATQEIANSVKQAATSTDSVLSHASEVSRASSETGDSANQMIAATGELSKQSELLRTEVDKFLSGVRA